MVVTFDSTRMPALQVADHTVWTTVGPRMGRSGLVDFVRMGRPDVEIRGAKAVLERVNERFPACDSQRRALRLYNFPHRSPGLTANKLT